jgi:hypothetical protein
MGRFGSARCGGGLPYGGALTTHLVQNKNKIKQNEAKRVRDVRDERREVVVCCQVIVAAAGGDAAQYTR